MSTNADGLFTKAEQSIAQSIMTQQQGLAMGLYAGPSNKASLFHSNIQNESVTTQLQTGITWLDEVSNDEKTTIAWAYARASAVVSYEITSSPGQSFAGLNTSNPLANLVTRALSTSIDNLQRAGTTTDIQTSSDLLRQRWFKGFGDVLAAAQAQTLKLYSTD